MLRIASFVVAVAAIIAIPLSQADARHGGMGGGGMRMGGGGMRMGSTHFSSARSFSGVRSVGTVRSFNTYRSANVIGNRRIFVGNRIHHRRYPFFVGVGAYGYGYGSCWRWVPTAYGYSRVWVCDPYDYY
jgi:hypothetical protein